MTIAKVILPVKPISKPRGMLNRYGKITHSLGGYRQWQKEFHSHISSTSFIIPNTFHSIVFQFNITPVRGHPPDLSNMQGAVEDALVKYKYLKDDNWKILTRFYTFATVSKQPSIILYVAESKEELLFIINKLTTS